MLSHVLKTKPRSLLANERGDVLMGGCSGRHCNWPYFSPGKEPPNPTKQQQQKTQANRRTMPHCQIADKRKLGRAADKEVERLKIQIILLAFYYFITK